MCAILLFFTSRLPNFRMPGTKIELETVGANGHYYDHGSELQKLFLTNNAGGYLHLNYVQHREYFAFQPESIKCTSIQDLGGVTRQG